MLCSSNILNQALATKHMSVNLQCARLEGAIQQLQVNFASAHQKHKTETIKMEETSKTLEQDLHDSRKHLEIVKDDLSSRIDDIHRLEVELKSSREEGEQKREEVSDVPVIVK